MGEKKLAKKLKKLEGVLDDYGLPVEIGDEDLIDATGKVTDPILRQELAEDRKLNDPLVVPRKKKDKERYR